MSMKKLPSQLGWKTVLQWMGEFLEGEWISPIKFAELHQISYGRAYFHLWNLGKWTLINKRKIKKIGIAGDVIEYQISKRGINRLETMKKNTWCSCDKQKNCMGCLIESLVTEYLGTAGLSYLKKHLRK